MPLWWICEITVQGGRWGTYGLKFVKFHRFLKTFWKNVGFATLCCSWLRLLQEIQDPPPLMFTQTNACSVWNGKDFWALVCMGHWQQSLIYEFVVVKVFQCNFELHWVYKKSLSLDKKTDRDDNQIFLRPAPDKLKCTILISFLILLFEQVLTLRTACSFQIHWKLKLFLANCSGLCARKLWMKSSCSLL